VADEAELMQRLEAGVRDRLGWLRDHGYELGDARWPAVTLDSPRARLALRYSHGHGNRLVLGVSLQEHGDSESRSLSTIQRLSGLPEPLAPESADDVDAALERISDQLRAVEPLVAGDPDAFRTVRRREKEAETANELDYALEYAGRDAGEAWKERDLDRVVAILEPLEGHLPRHQQGWLDYARRNREGV
jgi:hypothetical protein